MSGLLSTKDRERARLAALERLRLAVVLLERADLGDLSDIARDLAADVEAAGLAPEAISG